MTITEDKVKLIVNEKIKHHWNNTNMTLQLMQDNIDKRFDKIESLIEKGFEKSDMKYATKQEHAQNKESISRVWKIIWAVITFVFLWLWGIMFLAIEFFLKQWK